MKKSFSVMLLFLLTVLLMTGCGSYKVEETTLFIKGNGTVVLSEIEEFPEDTYSKDELQKFIDDNIDDFNIRYGKGSVSLKSLKVKDGTIRMVTEFASPDAFSEFTNMKLSYGKIKDASDNGIRFTGDFVSVKKDVVSYCALEDILASGKLHYLVVSNEFRIQCPGNVLYASEEGVSLIDSSLVLTGPDKKMTQPAFEIPADGTEADSESEYVSEIESVGMESTEQESASDGSISEEELLQAVEEEISQQENGIFNFAEESEEISETANKYYIIIFK